MAYTSIASISWEDRGVTWTADFEVNGASSASNTFRVLDGRRRIGDKNINPFNPVLPSRLTTRVYDESRTIHDEILSNPNGDIAITVQKDGTIWHTGFLDRVKGGDAVRMDNPELTLVWNDGIPALKGMKLDEQGRDTLLETCYWLLEESGVTLPLRMAIAWSHVATDETVTRNSEGWQIRLDHQQAAGSKFEALEQILRYFNMQLFQEDGKWWILQRSYRDDGQSYDWEERETNGTVTTGSTDPTVALTDSDWKETTDDPVVRPPVSPSGWRHTQRFNTPDWENDDFSANADNAFTGNQEPEAWLLNGPNTNFDAANNEVSISSADGIGTTPLGYAEQIWGQPLLSDLDNNDTFNFRVKGRVEIINTGETSNIGVPVCEVAVFKTNATHDKQTTDETDNFTTTQTYVRTTVAQSDQTGGATRSFDDSFALTVPNTGDFDCWYLRVRCVTEADPDNDGNNEVNRVIYEQVTCDALQRNVQRKDREPYTSVRFTSVADGGLQEESTEMGQAEHSGPILFRFGVVNPHCGVWYEDTSESEFYPLSDGSVVHLGARSIRGDQFSEKRLNDRYEQHSRQLYRVEGYLNASTVALRDTVTYASRTWLPLYVDEWIRNENRKMGVIELREDDSPVDNVTVTGEGR